ncbi:hypothetical protein A3A40_02115 [Candidatus Kaiserbacteria bacterium RIFCSPLOWO2_01_FULL_54_20]|uniref:Uncharacterized protein n=1 Tax=Candidatus Kaiserbacteria bacterium RIFCSPLOWO2_01_FULL_54_20 TaxID=1798513 RepID=A0A1F6EJU1_9BACT|nr:MAG: hypothetical protein A3A40_02115 [Candidatus Kaiserbacteria bacterium RIFCSPLOWO2_01_FULL_54_20]
MKERVYTTSDGTREVEFRWSGNHNAHYVPVQTNGWRELPDGSFEAVTYVEGRGWVSDEKLAKEQGTDNPK